MPLDDKRFRPLEGAPDWSEEVFDNWPGLEPH